MRGSLFMKAWKSESSKYKILFASNKIENTILIIKDCPLKGQKNPNTYKGKLFYKSYYIKNLYLKKKSLRKWKGKPRSKRHLQQRVCISSIHLFMYFFSYKSIKKKIKRQIGRRLKDISPKKISKCLKNKWTKCSPSSVMTPVRIAKTMFGLVRIWCSENSYTYNGQYTLRPSNSASMYTTQIAYT